jgi:surfeit locus 1 family protein
MSPRARIVFFILALLVAAVCVRLGLWQHSRLHERRARNATIEARRSEPVVDLDAAHGDLPDRRVRARGYYDPGGDMLLRNQVVNEVPGVLVATPLRLAGSDTAVIVIRGFVPAPDGLTVPHLDSLREPGPQVVEGIAVALEARPDSGRPVERDGRLSWSRLDVAALARRLPYPVLDVALLQSPSPDLPRWPRRQPPRALDDGAHLSYMLQWFAFAAIALVMGSIVLLARRGTRWSEPTVRASSAAGPPPPPPA